MKKLILIFSIIFFIGILPIVISCSSSAPPTPTPIPNSIDLRTILDLRDANEVAADAKYIGTYVELKGVINTIHEKDFTIIPIGSDEFQVAGAKCKFAEEQMDELIKMRKGEQVTIIGTIKSIDDLFFNMINISPCTFTITDSTEENSENEYEEIDVPENFTGYGIEVDFLGG